MAPTACSDYMPVARLNEMPKKGCISKSSAKKGAPENDFRSCPEISTLHWLDEAISGQPTVKPRVRR